MTTAKTQSPYMLVVWRARPSSKGVPEATGKQAATGTLGQLSGATPVELTPTRQTEPCRVGSTAIHLGRFHRQQGQ